MARAGLARAALVWGGLALTLGAALWVAATSPLLAWREPVYVAAGFAGVVGLCLIVLQPLLAGGYLPGAPARVGRPAHRWVGVGLLAAVVVHVAGLWITSPPDVVDALLLRSPTPFSVWGVLATWAAFGAAALGAIRGRAVLRPMVWRLAHMALGGVVVVGTVVHALRTTARWEPSPRRCCACWRLGRGHGSRSTCGRGRC